MKGKKGECKESRIERQELLCRDCDQYVQFDLDLSLDGNHRLNCPVCGHEHYRLVEKGQITDIRWNPSWSIYPVSSSSIATSSTSTYSNYTTLHNDATDNTMLYDRWLNVGTSYK